MKRIDRPDVRPLLEELLKQSTNEDVKQELQWVQRRKTQQRSARQNRDRPLFLDSEEEHPTPNGSDAKLRRGSMWPRPPNDEMREQSSSPYD